MALNVSFVKEKTINTEVKDFNYIPAYKEYEKERQENEKERQAYYEDIQRRVNNGEFNGKPADEEEIKELIEQEIANIQLRQVVIDILVEYGLIQDGEISENKVAGIENLIVSYLENKKVMEVER